MRGGGGGYFQEFQPAVELGQSRPASSAYRILVWLPSLLLPRHVVRELRARTVQLPDLLYPPTPTAASPLLPLENFPPSLPPRHVVRELRARTVQLSKMEWTPPDLLTAM